MTLAVYLGGVKPLLMVSDPPYGVGIRPRGGGSAPASITRIEWARSATMIVPTGEQRGLSFLVM